MSQSNTERHFLTSPLARAIRCGTQQSRIPAALAGILIGATAPTTTAFAQDVAQGRVIEEVTVTARKKEESLQETPLSIQALNGGALERLGVKSFDDYALMLPSLSYQSSGPGQAQVYMRGASDGGDGNASGSQPSVAIYLDEQPVTAIGANLDLHVYDIARVEALAGPQSTLFGASSQAGTLRIITNKPNTDEFEAGFDISAMTTKSGDPSHIEEAYVNVPLSDSAAIRLVGWNKSQGGYIDNIAGERDYAICDANVACWTPTIVQRDNASLVEENFNSLDTTGMRASALVDFSDRWSVTLSYIDQKQESEGVWFHDPENPNGEIGDLEVQRFYDDGTDDHFTQAGITLEGDLEFATLVYAGSFMNRDMDTASDYSDYTDYNNTSWIQYYGCEYYGTASEGDCTDMGVFYQSENAYERDTHEIRLQSNGDGAFNYLVGLYIEDSSHDYRQEWVMEGMAKGPDFRLFNEPDLWYLTDQKRIDNQKAVFGEVTYDFSEAMSLTLGARYFENESELSGVSGYGLIAPGYPIIAVDTKVEDSGSIVKATLNYDLSDSVMIYGTFSEGYRPGGLNRDETAVVERVYKPDYLTNYEFGWKSDWMDGTLRWNGAAYYMSWDDMQLTKFDSSFGSPVGLTINVSEAEITGIESDVTWLVSESWTLSAAASFNNAELSKDLVVGVKNAPAGTELPRVPEFKANVSARYNTLIGGMDSYAQLVWAYVDDSYNDVFKYSSIGSTTDVRTVQDGYDIVNLSAGVDQMSWGLELFVSNLLDERAQITRGAQGGASWDSTVTTNRPRTIGVKFKMRF